MHNRLFSKDNIFLPFFLKNKFHASAFFLFPGLPKKFIDTTCKMTLNTYGFSAAFYVLTLFIHNTLLWIMQRTCRTFSLYGKKTRQRIEWTFSFTIFLPYFFYSMGCFQDNTVVWGLYDALFWYEYLASIVLRRLNWGFPIHFSHLFVMQYIAVLFFFNKWNCISTHVSHE